MMALIALGQVRIRVRTAIGDTTLISHLIVLLSLIPGLHTPLLTLIAVGHRWLRCESMNRISVRFDTGG